MPSPRLSPGALCRMDGNLIRSIADGRGADGVGLMSTLVVLLGSAAYGAAFGAWRSATQAGYSALKMPLLIFSVVAAGTVVNFMLSQLLGARLSMRQVCICVLLSLAISSALLGALSPIMLFFSLQAPGPDSSEAMSVYRLLLPAHTAVIGLCGIVGHVRLYQLLRSLTGSPTTAWRVLASWIIVSGLAGCELSWVFSPFLAKPGIPVPMWNPDAFNGNFFEYLWWTAQGCL